MRVFRLSLLLTVGLLTASVSMQAQLQEEIRSKVELATADKSLLVEGERLYAPEHVASYYEKRAFEPCWISNGKLNSMAKLLLLYIQIADYDGLVPNDYHYEKLERLADSIIAEGAGSSSSNSQRSLQLQASTEILLSDAFFLLASHLYLGKVDSEAFTAYWHLDRPSSIDFVSYLQEGIDNKNLGKKLEALRPAHKEYNGLRMAYAQLLLLETAGGWQSVDTGEKIEPGEEGNRIEQVRARLEQVGYLSPVDSQRQVYDDELLDAVMKFQKDAGLNSDGVIGKSTIAAMNVPVSERLKQVRINLERLRWLPDSLGVRHVRVNIANFKLEVIDSGRIAFLSKAVVGRYFRMTPVFSSKMTYLVFNPYWTIPKTILDEDVLPEIRESTNYLSKNNMRVYDKSGKPVDPAEVDWETASGEKYTFRQDPGRGNSLGLIKFMFPNEHSVYIHDTPSKRYFSRDERALSSGCVRIEDPLELASFLLEGQEDWDFDKVQGIIDDKKTKTVTLDKAVPVHLVYLTAWATKHGSARFRKDIYKRDPIVYKALNEKPPKAG